MAVQHEVDWWGDPALVLIPDDTDDFIQRPNWHRRGLCRGTMENGTNLWFSASSRDRTLARAHCRVCPVAVECRMAAAEVRGFNRVGSHGVWAGQ